MVVTVGYSGPCSGYRGYSGPCSGYRGVYSSQTRYSGVYSSQTRYSGVTVVPAVVTVGKQWSLQWLQWGILPGLPPGPIPRCTTRDRPTLPHTIPRVPTTVYHHPVPPPGTPRGPMSRRARAENGRKPEINANGVLQKTRVCV